MPMSLPTLFRYQSTDCLVMGKRYSLDLRGNPASRRNSRSWVRRVGRRGIAPYGVVLLLFCVDVKVAEGAVIQVEVDWADSVLDLEAGIVPVNDFPDPHTRLQKDLEKEAVPLHYKCPPGMTFFGVLLDP